MITSPFFSYFLSSSWDRCRRPLLWVQLRSRHDACRLRWCRPWISIKFKKVYELTLKSSYWSSIVDEVRLSGPINSGRESGRCSILNTKPLKAYYMKTTYFTSSEFGQYILTGLLYAAGWVTSTDVRQCTQREICLQLASKFWNEGLPH